MCQSWQRTIQLDDMNIGGTHTIFDTSLKVCLAATGIKLPTHLDHARMLPRIHFWIYSYMHGSTVRLQTHLQALGEDWVGGRNADMLHWEH